MLNFDRFTVKHGTQNIQNDCHQHCWSNSFVTALECTKFVFGRGSLAGVRGTNSKREREGEKGKREGERRGKEGETPPPLLSQIFGSAPGVKFGTGIKFCG